MIVDVMGWSFIICVIAFITLILCSIVISCVTDLTENKPANVFLGSLGIILVVSFIVSVTTFIIGQDDISKNHLEISLNYIIPITATQNLLSQLSDIVIM